MSIRVMSMVWDGFPGGGSDLLAMLALADWSDDEGRCFPSMSAIAAKTRLSRSQAQRVVHGLIDGGYIQVVGNEFGGAPGMTRQYRIILSSLTGRMGATGSAHATGSADAQDGPHGCADTGRMGATQTVSEPSVNRKGGESPASPSPLSDANKKKKASSECHFATWEERTKAAGEKLIADYQPLWGYVDRAGIPEDFIALAWEVFKGLYGNGGAREKKRYRDWRQTFRNAVEQNWFSLWSANADGYRLTSKGEQAMNAHGMREAA